MCSHLATFHLVTAQMIVPHKLLQREISSDLARDARVTEFLACVHFAILPFRAVSLARAQSPREASVACAKVTRASRHSRDLPLPTLVRLNKLDCNPKI